MIDAIFVIGDYSESIYNAICDSFWCNNKLIYWFSKSPFTFDSEHDDKLLTNVRVVDYESAHITRLVDAFVNNNNFDIKNIIFLKGEISTADYLKSLMTLMKRYSTGNMFSHVAWVSSDYIRGFWITDAAININPNMVEKYNIVDNACEFHKRVWNTQPKIALITADPKNKRIQVSKDNEDIILNLNRHWTNMFSVSFDSAYSKACYNHKHNSEAIWSDDFNVMVFPDITAANSVWKCLEHCAGAKIAGFVAGTRLRVGLNSRNDRSESKALTIDMLAQLKY